MFKLTDITQLFNASLSESLIQYIESRYAVQLSGHSQQRLRSRELCGLEKIRAFEQCLGLLEKADLLSNAKTDTQTDNNNEGTLHWLIKVSKRDDPNTVERVLGQLQTQGLLNQTFLEVLQARKEEEKFLPCLEPIFKIVKQSELKDMRSSHVESLVSGLLSLNLHLLLDIQTAIHNSKDPLNKCLYKNLVEKIATFKTEIDRYFTQYSDTAQEDLGKTNQVFNEIAKALIKVNVESMRLNIYVEYALRLQAVHTELEAVKKSVETNNNHRSRP